MKIINQKNKNNGFTLIELMMSIGIFTLVMVVAIGSFMSSTYSAKKSKALRIAMDNVNFVMDNITRELRVGSFYDNNIPTSQISFHPYDTIVPIRFFYLDTVTGTVNKCDHALPPSTSAVCSQLNAPEVNITKLEFTVYDDANVGANTQPSVYIEIEGRVDINGVVETFDLHTLASQRNAE